LAEQNVQAALKLCNRGYVLENGRIVMSGESQHLLNSPQIKQAYLGK
jgi:branched-chain amino acid transport system ATP-binding protein